MARNLLPIPLGLGLAALVTGVLLDTGPLSVSWLSQKWAFILQATGFVTIAVTMFAVHAIPAYLEIRYLLPWDHHGFKLMILMLITGLALLIAPIFMGDPPDLEGTSGTMFAVGTLLLIGGAIVGNYFHAPT